MLWTACYKSRYWHISSASSFFFYYNTMHDDHYLRISAVAKFIYCLRVSGFAIQLDQNFTL